MLDFIGPLTRTFDAVVRKNWVNVGVSGAIRVFLAGEQ